MRTTGGPPVGKPGEPLRYVEAALGAEVDVDERDVGREGQRLVDGLVRCRGEADDRDPVVGEELPGGLEERRAVVHDQAGERGNGRRRGHCTGRIAAALLPRQTENGRLVAR